MAAELRSLAPDGGRARGDSHPVVSDGRRDASGHPEISGHRRPRRLERRAGRPRTASRLEVEGGSRPCASGSSPPGISIRSRVRGRSSIRFVEAGSSDSRRATASTRRGVVNKATLRDAQRAGRRASAAARDQYRPAEGLFRRSWRSLRDREHSRRFGRDGRKRGRLFASPRRRRQDRSSVADHADQGDRDQFQPVLDTCRLRSSRRI